MPVTTRKLAQWKEKGERFTVLTAYDYSMAKLVGQAGIKVVLVGDSLGNVIQGQTSTLPVTLEEMIYHCRAVVKALPECLVIADMPFLSCQVSIPEAIRNAGRVMKEAGVQAVKVEGGEEMAETVRAMTRAGIAVMGHIGLRPQSIHQLGGYATQAKDEAGLQQLLADGRALEKAGAFAVVVEKVAPTAAQSITAALTIPVIGCGAGPDCDAQVLVTYDLLGLFADFTPSFVKRYAELGAAAISAMQKFDQDVRAGKFPEKAAAPKEQP
jgi:3-methyl-2-oxobutanoate hydroxymethyltransferase